MKKTVIIPNELKPILKDNILTIEGPKGKAGKEFKSRIAEIKLEGNTAVIESRKESRTGKAIINTFRAHIKNLIKGVTEGYEARMKICYSHYPCTAKVEGDKLIIENFVGEKIPRTALILGDCKVKVNGAELIITGNSKELVGQTAANIETATKIRKKDLRCFQDGIWITKKPGKRGL